MTYTTLQVERQDDGIALVTINRPDKLNALNNAVIGELQQAVSDLAADAAVHGVIVTGAGPKAFVAGADIREIAALDAAGGEALALRGQAVFRAIERMPKPVVAAINGFALGGGCELAMACHVRLAAPNARFGQPEVTLGLIPGYGGTVRLPRLVGRGRALDLLLTGRMIDAAEAERIGLVNAVVPAESLLGEARKLLGTMLRQGPVALRLALACVDVGLDLDLDSALREEATRFGEACGTEDKGEGTAAFLERRPPTFVGR